MTPKLVEASFVSYSTVGAGPRARPEILQDRDATLQSIRQMSGKRRKSVGINVGINVGKETGQPSGQVLFFDRDLRICSQEKGITNHDRSIRYHDRLQTYHDGLSSCPDKGGHRDPPLQIKTKSKCEFDVGPQQIFPDVAWKKGMRANQNSAFKLKSTYTLNTLLEFFGLDE